MKMYNKRQHPIVIVSKLFGNLKSAIIPLLPILILSGDNGGWIIKLGMIGALFVFSLCNGITTWLTTTYSINDDELHFKTGWLFKKEKFIKRSRVQSITTQAGILQQIFTLEKVTIETAGGKKPEVELLAITQEDALAVRMALKKENDVIEPTEILKEQHEIIEETKTAFTLQPKEVLIGGMTSGGIGLLFSAMLALFGKFYEAIPDEAFDYAFDYAFALFGEVSIMTWLIVAFIALFGAWIISIAYFALSYGNFSITKHNDELHIIRGILEKKEISIKQHRIQGITLVEGLLRQPFGYMAVYIKAVASTGDKQDKKILIHPFIHRSKLASFLDEMAPSFIYTAESTSLPKRTCDRWIFQGTVTMMIIATSIAIPVTYFTPVTNEISTFLSVPTFVIVSIFILLLTAIGAAYSYILYRSSGFVLLTKQVQLSTRILAKRTSIIHKKNIQALGYKESYLQRRKSLQTLTLAVLSAESESTLSLQDMDKKDVQRIYEWFSRSKKKEAKS
jgi:putative membrane protein